MAAVDLSPERRAALRSVYETGGSRDYASVTILVVLGLVRWDGASQMYRTTKDGIAALREAAR